MVFEILCIDQKSRVKFKDRRNFLEALAFNEELWPSDPVKENDNLIKASTHNLEIKIDNIDITKVVADLFTSAFILKVNADQEIIEPLRVKLLQHLRTLGFNHLRILTDEASTDLALKIYPLIHSIENQLRRYIVKFFITKIGLGWFEISVSKEVKDKTKIRKDNEIFFTKSGLVDTDVTLIDFNELGEIITRQTTVYSKVEDVIEKINTAASLEVLKNEVAGHYPKYFKTIFEKQKFESKWKTLFEIRNRVAHNNYLTQNDLTEADTLVLELQTILQEAEEKIDEAVLTISEKQAINKALLDVVSEQETADSQEAHKETENDNIESKTPTISNIIFNHYLRNKLTEDIYIDELRKFKELNPNWKFIALSQFFDYLENKGYYRQIASTLTSILLDRNRIRIEYIDNPNNVNHHTATITEVVNT